MRSIGLFLNRFKNITPPKRFICAEFCDVVKNEMGFKLDDGLIDVRGGVLYISATGPLKHAIYSRRHDLLKELNKRLESVGGDIHEMR